MQLKHRPRAALQLPLNLLGAPLPGNAGWS